MPVSSKGGVLHPSMQMGNLQDLHSCGHIHSVLDRLLSWTVLPRACEPGRVVLQVGGARTMLSRSSR
jgi:hypothetical protein